MFSVFCPIHDTRVLMTRRNVVSFWNGPHGPVIRWKCTCGHEGFLDHNGQTADCTDCTDCTDRTAEGVQAAAVAPVASSAS